MNTPADLQIYRAWRPDRGLLDMVRGLFAYGPGDDRATGYLYVEGEQDWPPALAGADLLANLERLLAVRYPIVAFQAYRNGSGCDWHSDDPFDAQAVLSLGATRTFGVRPRAGGEPRWTQVADGDLVVMPSGFQDLWQHSVPIEPVTGERISLVCRTRRS